MSYTIQEIRWPCDDLDEIARFLAGFVSDGELPSASVDDTHPEVWRRRLENWWVANPFCREDSLLGFKLKKPNGDLVGFHGFIPHDYELRGAIVPALIATTFFVREAHRHAALGILMRVKRATAKFHIVDGSPSPEMQSLLGRLDFEKSPSGSQHYRIIGGRKSLSPKAQLFNVAAKFSNQSTSALSPSFSIIRDPAEIISIPEINDSKLRKRVTGEGLAWLVNRSPSKPIFRGFCDEDGSLRAYFIAVSKSKFGLQALRVVEAASFDGDNGCLAKLLETVSTRSTEAALPANADILIWSMLNAHPRPHWPIRSKWQTHLYFKIPGSLPCTEKVCLPSEGDTLFL